MTSHDEHSVSPEFQQLMVETLDGRLGDEKYTRLMQLLHENPEYRDYYVEQMVLHSLLVLNHRDPLPCGPGPSASSAIAPLFGSTGDWPNIIVDEPTNTPKQPPTEGFMGFIARSFGFGSRILANPAYFSILILCFMISPLALFFFLDHQTDQLVVIPPSLVAKLTQVSDDAQWATSETMSPGMDLPWGKILTLKKGLAEIEFRSGATVLLQGPIAYRLDGTNASFLQAGTLTAQVPKSASGFSVATPNTKVVDLGTEFGMTVDAKKATEVHVFVGKVVLSADAGETPNRQPKKCLLNAGQAVMVSMTNTGVIARGKPFTAAPKKFVRCMDAKPPAEPKIVYAHHGNVDPLKEGWTVRATSKDGSWGCELLPFEANPIRDSSAVAWMLQNRWAEREIQYFFMPHDDAAREIAKRGREQGWVMRARIKLEDAGPGTFSSAYCIYVDQGRSWPLFFSLCPKGSYVDIHGKSSLGNLIRVSVPNADNRYVDFEVRYNPATKDANVLVDGKCVATAFSNEEKMMEDGFYFGLQKRKSKAKFALIEWEVLDKPLSTEQSRGM